MKVIIIGNGISGITAAKQLRELSSEVEIQVISEETPYFFARTALMYVFMQHMKEQDLFPHENWFWSKKQISLIHEKVVEIDPKQKWVRLRDQQKLVYDHLILAVGSRTRNLQVPGSDLEGIQGFYSWQDLQKWQNEIPKASTVAIIGGGLIGVELAEMMVCAKKKTYLLIREDSYWSRILPKEESELISCHIASHGVHLIRQTEALSFIGKHGRVAQIELSTGESLPVDWVGMSIGVEPRLGEIQVNDLAINQGIVVNDYLETSLPDVYAIGDCAESQNPPPGRAAIEAMWYTGRQMGEYVAKRILGYKQPYQRELYFNSAKFFDLEYQIYGYVPSSVHPDIKTFHWSHQNMIFRIAFDSTRRNVLGVSGIGLRLRQQVWTQWIESQQTVEECLQHWEKGSFDPEFTPAWGKCIRSSFTDQTGFEFKSAKKWNWLKK
ncbi:MAG: NAD(P)/FAD-dependent oxidoreductase [Spirosomataceae bacterium]